MAPSLMATSSLRSANRNNNKMNEEILFHEDTLKEYDHVINDPRWCNKLGYQMYQEIRGLATRDIDLCKAHQIKDVFETPKEIGNYGFVKPTLLKREHRLMDSGAYVLVYKRADLHDICREVSNEEVYPETENKDYDQVFNHPRTHGTDGFKRYQELRGDTRTTITLDKAQEIRNKFQEPMHNGNGVSYQPIMWKRYEYKDDLGRKYYVLKRATLEDIIKNVKGKRTKKRKVGPHPLPSLEDMNDIAVAPMMVDVARAPPSPRSPSSPTAAKTSSSTQIASNVNNDQEPMETLRHCIDRYRIYLDNLEGNRISYQKEAQDFRKTLDVFQALPYADELPTEFAKPYDKISSNGYYAIKSTINSMWNQLLRQRDDSPVSATGSATRNNPSSGGSDSNDLSTDSFDSSASDLTREGADSFHGQISNIGNRQNPIQGMGTTMYFRGASTLHAPADGVSLNSSQDASDFSESVHETVTTALSTDIETSRNGSASFIESCSYLTSNESKDGSEVRTPSPNHDECKHSGNETIIRQLGQKIGIDPPDPSIIQDIEGHSSLVAVTAGQKPSCTRESAGLRRSHMAKNALPSCFVTDNDTYVNSTKNETLERPDPPVDVSPTRCIREDPAGIHIREHIAVLHELSSNGPDPCMHGGSKEKALEDPSGLYFPDIIGNCFPIPTYDATSTKSISNEAKLDFDDPTKGSEKESLYPSLSHTEDSVDAEYGSLCSHSSEQLNPNTAQRETRLLTTSASSENNVGIEKVSPTTLPARANSIIDESSTTSCHDDSGIPGAYHIGGIERVNLRVDDFSQHDQRTDYSVCSVSWPRSVISSASHHPLEDAPTARLVEGSERFPEMFHVPSSYRDIHVVRPTGWNANSDSIRIDEGEADDACSPQRGALSTEQCTIERMAIDHATKVPRWRVRANRLWSRLTGRKGSTVEAMSSTCNVTETWTSSASSSPATNRTSPLSSLTTNGTRDASSAWVSSFGMEDELPLPRLPRMGTSANLGSHFRPPAIPLQQTV